VPDFRTSVTTELSAVLDRLILASDAAVRVAREQAAAEAQVAIDRIAAERTAAEQALREQTFHPHP